MTHIQQVHWELEMDYIGHPYYVSGNAILHALGQHLPQDVHQHLHASHGIFLPGQFGRFPEEHSQSGFPPYIGKRLPEVEAYDDLFLFRDPCHQWLLDSHPRDALNTHDIRVQSRHPALAQETIMGRPESAHRNKLTTNWYIQAYVHADTSDILPLGEDVLDNLQFGGKRNYGYGTVSLNDTQVVDLDGLDYSRIADGNRFAVKLVTPFVLESEYPGALDVDVPWWWTETRDELREREERILEQCDVYRLQTIDHGQVVRYAGDKPVETAKNGLLRVGSHSKYGFGELRVKPIDTQDATVTATPT